MKRKLVTVAAIAVLEFSSIALIAQTKTQRQVSINDNFSTLGNKMVCPVMENRFNATKNSVKSEYKGKVYIFCCPGCKPPFDKNPEKHIK